MKQDHLNQDEKHRYSRHIAIPSFGLKGQTALKNSSVLVIGAGGLGAPALLYLAAAGVGNIGIIEFDTIDKSNLQRQVLYKDLDVGKSKIQTAKNALASINHNVNYELFDFKLTTKNAIAIISSFDIVLDCSDNFPTRYLINDACVLAKKPFIYGSIFRFEGQVAVFNALLKDGSRSTNYRDLFPQPPNPNTVLNCEEGGVLGAVCGVVGSMQAAEAIKLLSATGEPLIDRLFIIDLSSFSTTTLKIKARNDYKVEQLIDYDTFCGINKISMSVKEISIEEFKTIQTQGSDYQLVDVREPQEHYANNIKGELIPLQDIISQKDKIASNKKVIIYCLSGKRSATAVSLLQEELGFENLYNLKGGIQAWRRKYGNTK